MLGLGERLILRAAGSVNCEIVRGSGICKLWNSLWR
jgi:hypothetical protein